MQHDVPPSDSLSKNKVHFFIRDYPHCNPSEFAHAAQIFRPRFGETLAPWFRPKAGPSYPQSKMFMSCPV
jgi:hypothetical protein